MLAIRTDGQAPFLDRSAPEPAPGEGEALVRVIRCAVDATDVAAARGDYGFRGVLGRMFVGEVVEVSGGGVGGAGRGGAGRGGSGIGPGRRVVCGINVVDPRTELARRGLGIHDPQRRVIGLRGRDGCLAERIAVPTLNLAPVPDGIDDERACLAQAVADAVHASRMTRLEGKGFVTVLGDSPAALLCAQVMVRLNNTVRVIAPTDRRFALCERWGVRHRLLGEIGLREDQDVVIECTGTPEGVATALRLVRPRGKVVLKADPLPVPGLPVERGGGADLTPAVLNEVELLGARDGSISEGLEALAWGAEAGRPSARHALDVEGLITARTRLADGVACLRSAAEENALTVSVACG